LQSNARVNDSRGQWRITHQPSTSSKQKDDPKIKLENVAHFLALENTPPKHHIHHTSHHDFTTQKPRSSTHFFQNTPKKPKEIDETSPRDHARKIPSKISG
jgi:hypothetical protein